ncbi:MAG: putative Ig domain-containing protein [Candidatus Thiodiazotropha sp.]
MRSLQTILIALFISLMLSACGGGSSTESTETASNPQDETIVSNDGETAGNTNDTGTPADNGSQDNSGSGSTEETTDPTPTPVAPPVSSVTNPTPAPSTGSDTSGSTETPVEEAAPVTEEEAAPVVEETVTRGAPVLLTANISGEDVLLSWNNDNSDPDGGYDVWIDELDMGTDRTAATSATITGLDLGVRHCFKIESRYVEASEFYVSNEMCTEAQAAANEAPTISGTPETSVDVGSAYSFTPSADDADGDDLSFSVANLPFWASFNTNTGALTGTPAAQDVGDYNNIRITVTDGTDDVTLAAFSIRVNTVEVAAATGSMSLRWTAPSTRIDGTPLSLADIDGYTIYVGTSQSNLQMYVDVNRGDISSYTIDDIELGNYYVAISAYDLSGRASELSNVVMKSVN